MSNKIIEKIIDMTDSQLNNMLKKEREDIAKVSIEINASKFRDTNLVKKKKRKIAKFLTELRRRELVKK
jgi:ribosomal protein L29